MFWKRWTPAEWTDAAVLVLALLALACVFFTVPAAFADPTDRDVDTDQDGVRDMLDNCTLLSNPDQIDRDQDGYGDLCDPDFTQDGIVNDRDWRMMQVHLLQPVTTPQARRVDMNLDGAVNAADVWLLKNRFAKPPGPSCCGEPLP